MDTQSKSHQESEKPKGHDSEQKENRDDTASNLPRR